MKTRDLIQHWCSFSQRCVVLASRDVEDSEFSEFQKDWDQSQARAESDLVFDCLVGSQDPLRQEVRGAVSACERAGIRVRMLTGDNIVTSCKRSL